MKNIKTLYILFLSVLIISCSKKDEEGDGGDPAQPEFNATINGGSFESNYMSHLGYSSNDYDNDNSLTLAITDQNSNVIRFFFNQTGGFGTGITKIVGDVDGNGLITSVVIRDQVAEITYFASEGEINILGNRANPDSEDGRLISGNFTITASAGVGSTITMTGNFKDFVY